MADEKKQGFKMPEPDETIVLSATSPAGEKITLNFGELRELKKLVAAKRPRK